MRLLQTNKTAQFTLTKYVVAADPTPPYAILSHIWGLDNEEVTFKDMMNGTARG